MPRPSLPDAADSSDFQQYEYELRGSRIISQTCEIYSQDFSSLSSHIYFE